jgi:hypothetical protein
MTSKQENKEDKNIEIILLSSSYTFDTKDGLYNYCLRSLKGTWRSVSDLLITIII